MTKGVVHGVDFGHCAARHEGAGVNVRVSLHTQCIFTCDDLNPTKSSTAIRGWKKF